ncbi:hypothetical protein [Sutcliffiella horikoshii]|uniref:hypothetical protein n=1 Tax=Sutcliffiella horikoshii TaxID=79883 RepID=UPI00384C1EAA
MRFIWNELSLWFKATIYIWIYYFIFIIFNPTHPLDTYGQVTIIGSFLGLPLIMWILIPIWNALHAFRNKSVRWKPLRLIIYICSAYFVLLSAMTIHAEISNSIVKERLFPEGWDKHVAWSFERLQSAAEGDLTLKRAYYTEPYHSNINAGNMSGTRSPVLTIEYINNDCSDKEECLFIYKEFYDASSGVLIRSENDSY